MPKATLTFDLPEEATEFDLAVRGSDRACAIDDLDNWLREQEKYCNRASLPVDEVRAKLREVCGDRGVEFP